MKLIWYAFIAVYILTSLGLATLNGAGVIFGLGLLGFGVLLHLVWLGLGELRLMRLATQEGVNTGNAGLELQAGIADATQTTAQLLEALQNEPTLPTPAAHHNGVKS
jgi:hypothetical protein